jgi:hypothetical protein
MVDVLDLSAHPKSVKNESNMAICGLFPFGCSDRSPVLERGGASGSSFGTYWQIQATKHVRFLLSKGDMGIARG